MKYKFTNLVLRDGIVPQTARSHQGEKYSWITADLFNEADPFGNPSRLPRYFIMEDNMVEMFRPFCEPIPGETGAYKVNEVSLKASISKGDTPDILHINNVFMVEIPLNEDYVRLDRMTQKPIVNKNGQIIPTRTLTLYIKKTIDTDTNESVWVESPSRVAERILNRSYMPYSTIAPSVTQTPAAQTAPQAPTARAQETDEERKARLQAELAALG